MFKHGFPPEWSTFKKLIWLVGTGIAGASYIWKTLTGTLIHITDALASPMQKCEVTLEPVQDLHGQDAPYPAGGGKNKCNAQNPIVLSSAGNIGDQPCVIPAGSYVYSATTSAQAAFQFSIYNSNGDRLVNLSSPSSVTGRHSIAFTISEDATYLRCYYNAATTISDIQVEAGSTATPYSPYSNICPITGWTGANIYHSGEDTSDPTTYTISWQDDAGTVYGGTVDLVSGVLTVDRVYRHLKDFVWASNNAGSIGWEYYSSTSVTGKKKGATNIISDQFKTVSAYSNVAQYTIRGFANADYIAINFPAELVPSSVEVTQWLTEHDAVACYELAEPIEIQLTPQEISTLNGVNNVWSNTNGDTTVIYKAQSS